MMIFSLMSYLYGLEIGKVKVLNIEGLQNLLLTHLDA